MMIQILYRFAAGAALAAAMIPSPVPAQSPPDKTVLISISKASEPFFVALRRAGEDEARKLGIRVIFEDGKGDSVDQTADVENGVDTGKVDGVLIAPNDVYALVPAVNHVRSKGIPLITFDRQIYGASPKVPHVGVDNVAGGRLLAQWVIDRFPEGARILHLTGQPGSSTAIDRAKGVRDRFAEAGDKYRIVVEVSANWSRAEALMATEGQLTFLESPPDVIVADNDDMAMGALEAIKRVGLEKAGIKVIGYDALPFALQAVREGTLGATVDQQGGQQIRTALKQMVEHLRNGTPLRSVTFQPILVTRDNLEAFERSSASPVPAPQPSSSAP